MDAPQIKDILRLHSRLQDIQVLPIDQFAQLEKTGLFIVNNKPTGHRGEHWFAVATDCSPVEVFDSTGTNPCVYWPDLQSKLGDEFIMNPTRLQSHQSTVCWAYALYYCIKHVLGIPLTNILFKFTNDCTYNDYCITSFMHAALCEL